MSKVKIGAVLAAVALGGAACGSGGAADSADQTYDVLFIGGLSGAQSQIAEASVHGLEAAAAVLNEDGGIDGREVVVRSVDDGGQATAGVTRLQSALQGEDRPDLVVPGVTSDETLAMLPILTQNQVLSIGTGSAHVINDPEKYPDHFMLAPSSASQGEAAAAFAAKRGVTRIGVIVVDNAIGESQEELFEEAFQAEGMEVEVARFAPDATDMTPSWERLRAADVDAAMVLPEGGAQVAYLLKSRLQADFDLLTIGTGAFGGLDVASIVPAEAIEGVYALGLPIQYLTSEQRSESQSRFYNAVLAQGSMTSGLLMPAFHYDGLQLVAMAVEAAGTRESAEVAKSLETLRPDADAPLGLGFPYEYSAEDHETGTSGESPWHAFPMGPLVDGVFVSADGEAPS